MVERSEAKSAKRSFASKVKIIYILTRSFALRFLLLYAQPFRWHRVSNSHCEFALLRKKAKAKRIRFASHRFLTQGVRFASLSLFKRSNSQKSENFRLILAIIFQKNAFLSGWNLSFFRYFRVNYGKNNQDREGGLLSVRNLFGQTNFFTNGADFF